MKHSNIAAVALLCGLGALSGCVTQPVQPENTALTAVHFMDTASVKDDDLETTAMITTENGWKPAPNFLFGRIHDVFLRAFVDKKTGLTMYQVYTWLRYPGDSWRTYSIANYESAGGVKSTKIDSIGRPGVDCSMKSIGCIYTEHIGFEVPESTLRQWVESYKEKPIAPWRFRLKPRSGSEYDGELSTAEISGLLAKVDEYRLSKGLMKL